MSERPPLRSLIGVALVAGCTLALQVLLTRLFAAALLYHFAFFGIALALLGTGAGGILVYMSGRRLGGSELDATLSRWCSALALSLLAVPFVLVRLGFSPSGTVTTGFAVKLAVAGLVSALPFLAAGVVIALAIKRYVGAVARVYAFDLGGAALGSLAVVPLLWVVDAPTLIASLGVVGAIAGILFSGPWRRERLIAAGVALVALAMTAVAATTAIYYLPTGFDGKVVADHWTPISRVVGYPPTGPGSSALVSYDRDFAVAPHRTPGRLPNWRDMGLGPQSIGYQLTGPGRALVIGGGGGRDIYNALTSGQRRVDVIELNRVIRSTIQNELARWTGRPYSLTRVHVAIGDGRSTLAGRKTRYDQVHIGFATTLTSGAGQAYALAENTLYTVEAFKLYLAHLRPRGILSVTRHYHLAGEEALRATILMLEALRRHGVRNPTHNVVVMLGRDWFGRLSGTVLGRLEPFTPGELARVRRLARQRTLGLLFAPGGPYAREWRGLARAGSLRRFCEGYRVDVCPPTDDKPFFLNATRLRDVIGPASPAPTSLVRTPYIILLVSLGILLLLSGLAFAVPLLLGHDAGRAPASSLAFFAAIGLGFLLLEVVLIQRFVLFLGFPTYALSVVLFALLVFTGLGARLSERRPDRRTLVTALGVACVLIAAMSVALAPLLRGWVGLPFPARVALTVALLAPLGLALGTAMPIGLRRLAALHPSGIPWAWGINGVTSVLAAVLAVAAAVSWGFTVTTLIALACYLAALTHAALGRWPEGREI